MAVNRGEINGGAWPRDADSVQTVRAGSIPETTWINTVELGTGCAEMCLSCGAYSEGACVERDSITAEQLKANLSQEIIDIRGGAKMRLIDLFRSSVTTGPDMEPLDEGIFVEAAQLIYGLSRGKSRLVCISHGVRAKCMEDGKNWEANPKQLSKLKEVNDLMLADVVPLFVLSFDTARSRGLYGKNARKYYEERAEIEKSQGYAEVLKFIKSEGVKKQMREGMHTEDERMSEPVEIWQERCRKIKYALMQSVRSKVTARREELGISRERGLCQELTEGFSDVEKTLAFYVEKTDLLRDSVLESNARSYAFTLAELAPAIREGKRVTVSLQGDDDNEGLVYQGLAHLCYQRTMEILQKEFKVGSDVLAAISNLLQPPRAYASVGRAKSLVLDPTNQCAIIPDPEYVKHLDERDPWRMNSGRLRADGSLLVQLYRPDRTYNDWVNPNGIPGDNASPNPWKEVDLSSQNFAKTLSAPTGLIERMRHYAKGKVIKVPDEGLQESLPVKNIDLSKVYPFSELSHEDANLFTFMLKAKMASADDAVLSPGDIRRLFIDTAITKDYIAEHRRFDQGESEEMCRTRLIEEIIAIHNPGVELKDGVRMGEILAVQAVLQDVFEIEISLQEEDLGQN